MRGKIRTYYTNCKKGNRTDTRQIVRGTVCVFALFMCSVLCGCTRKEQLVLETGGAAQDRQAVSDGEMPEGAQETADGGVQAASDSAAQETQAIADSAAPEGTSEISGSGETATQKSVSEQTPPMIYVHICGAVEHPGVYELSAGSRVYEAVEKAGGFTENADESYVNQARELTDGMKLMIPTMEQTEALSVTDDAGGIGIVESGKENRENTEGAPDESDAPDKNDTSDGKVNINTASEAELCNIPGIGETRAAAIVAYRQERGGFTSIEDIMNVSGIKEGTYDKIKDRIKVK